MKKLILIILLLLNFSFANAGDIIQPVMIIPGWLQADSIYARAVLVDSIKTDHTTFKDSSITIESSDKTFITTDSVSIGGNFVVDKSGNVGIGTSPDTKLHVDGDISITSGNIFGTVAGSATIGLTNSYLYFSNTTGFIREGGYGHYVDLCDANLNLAISATGHFIHLLSNVGIKTATPGTTLEMADNTANAAHSMITILNDDEPATAETGQTSDVLFEMKGTIDNGSNYTNQESGKFSNYKISDYFHASDETDNDAGFKISTVTDGSYVLNTTFSDDDVNIAGDLTVTGSISGNSDYGEMGNVYGSDATEVLAVADQWYAMYHANINVGLIKGFTYTDGQAGAISATSTGAGATVTMTSAGHTLEADDWVTINGTTTYNGVEQVVSVDGNDFVVTATNSEADEGGGNAAFQEGSYLECNTAIKYRGMWTSCMTQSLANAQTTTISPYINGTQATKAVALKYLSNANDIAAPSGNGIMNFNVGDRIWFAIQSTAAQTITFKVRNISIH